MVNQVLGIDIGGRGIKGALVDVGEGKLASERHRVPTPAFPGPSAVADVVEEIVSEFNYQGPVGCTFPGVVMDQATVLTAANLEGDWVGANASELFSSAGRTVSVINDADAAGIAEMRFGAGRGVEGTVIMVTIGTGLGTAVFTDAALVPNTELGHMEIGGAEAESFASARAYERLGGNDRVWVPKLQLFLEVLENLLWPKLFILGGGISKSFDIWSPHLNIRTPTVAAQMRNHAGIVGAAMLAADSALDLG